MLAALENCATIHSIAANVVECEASVNAGIAQLVERNLAKVEVVGSRPISRSTFRQKGEAFASPFFAKRSDLAR